MEEPVTGSSFAGEMKGSAVDSGPLATAALHASGDVDATATQAKAEDAGEAEGIIDGWSGVGTSGDRKMVRKAQMWTSQGAEVGRDEVRNAKILDPLHCSLYMDAQTRYPPSCHKFIGFKLRPTTKEGRDVDICSFWHDGTNVKSPVSHYGVTMFQLLEELTPLRELLV